MGLVGLFSFGFSVTRHSQDVGVAYSVARQEIERAKNISFLLLPEATLVTGYNGLGDLTTEASPHFIATTIIQTLPDENGEFNATCLRTVNVQVVAREGNELVFESTTYLTRGGI
ncbi:MAG: hypothetical protein GTO55_04475, partial [Armatimonadetes bacterium]|nr:hypothetical protein [Armatimonadota bacterium]NIM23522.1 hypothetical protein [Armatimonadota bacterium]NIM67388.1 hypothetical protein [Armatimonadota bacterium]NIM75889.1 hypothetical protein [Armatimonadota bacterium]NIN05574.1 hypothetical protein [Armatimonadota bacterium]